MQLDWVWDPDWKTSLWFCLEESVQIWKTGLHFIVGGQNSPRWQSCSALRFSYFYLQLLVSEINTTCWHKKKNHIVINLQWCSPLWKNAHVQFNVIKSISLLHCSTCRKTNTNVCLSCVVLGGLFCYTCVFPPVSPLDCIRFPQKCPVGQVCLSSRAVGEKGETAAEAPRYI